MKFISVYGNIPLHEEYIRATINLYRPKQIYLVGAESKEDCIEYSELMNDEPLLNMIGSLHRRPKYPLCVVPEDMKRLYQDHSLEAIRHYSNGQSKVNYFAKNVMLMDTNAVKEFNLLHSGMAAVNTIGVERVTYLQISPVVDDNTLFILLSSTYGIGDIDDIMSLIKKAIRRHEYARQNDFVLS